MTLFLTCLPFSRLSIWQNWKVEVHARKELGYHLTKNNTAELLPVSPLWWYFRRQSRTMTLTSLSWEYPARYILLSISRRIERTTILWLSNLTDDLSTFESSLFVQFNYVLCVYSVTLLEWLGSIAIQVFQHSEHTSAQSVLAISNKPETQLLNKCIAASLQLQLNWTNQQTFGKPCCKL